jgi:hypothetical protein
MTFQEQWSWAVRLDKSPGKKWAQLSHFRSTYRSINSICIFSVAWFLLEICTGDYKWIYFKNSGKEKQVVSASSGEEMTWNVGGKGRSGAEESLKMYMLLLCGTRSVCQSYNVLNASLSCWNVYSIWKSIIAGKNPFKICRVTTYFSWYVFEYPPIENGFELKLQTIVT